MSQPGHSENHKRRILPALRGSPAIHITSSQTEIINQLLLWVTVAAVDLINIGDKLDTLTDDEEDNDHDKNPRHTGLLDIKVSTFYWLHSIQ